VNANSPQVSFETDYFQIVPGEDEETNPGRYGKALADWLADELKKLGQPVDEIIPEDFGWVLLASRKPVALWLACANMEGSATEWTVFAFAEPSLFQRLVSRPDSTEAIDSLWKRVTEIIPTIPRIREVRWER
jgi:hypothetical protein